MMSIVLVVWLVLLIGLSCPSHSNGAGNGLSVSVQADWPTHELSPLMEASEFVDNQLFWKFVELAVEKPIQVDGFVDAVDIAVRFGSSLFPKEDLLSKKLLRLSVELRAFAPAIEYQRQLGLSLCEFVGVDAETIHDKDAWVGLSLKRSETSSEYSVFHEDDEKKLMEQVDTLLAELKKSENSADEKCGFASSDPFQIFEHDHVHPSSVITDGPQLVVILHGVLGTEKFTRFHKMLRDKVEALNSILYVIRFMPPEMGASKTYLQGYGAEMDIKNMEYLTVDEDKESSSSSSSSKSKKESGDVDLSKPVGGLIFSQLLKAFPGHEDNLKAFHREILEGEEAKASKSNELEQIKVWDMADLGMQATWKILSSPEALDRWVDITQNFPLRAKNLIKLEVPKALKRKMEKAHTMLEIGDSAEINLNGLRIDAASESFNVFSVLEMVKGEAEFASLATYFNNKVPNVVPLIRKIAGMIGVGDDGEEDDNDPNVDQAVKVLKSLGLRVDMRNGAKGSIIFLNNVEKDSMYSRWPASLEMLLQPSYQLIPVRKNLYTSIIIIDPATKSSREVLGQVFNVIRRGAPVRFGVVFADSSTPQNDDGVICGARCFVGLFLVSMKVSGKDVALQVIEELAAQSGGGDGTIDIATALATFVRVNREQASMIKRKSEEEYETMAKEALAPGAEETDKTFLKMKKYVASKGLKIPCWTVNGLVFTSTAGFEANLPQTIFQEQRMLAYQYHYKKITEDSDIFKYVLSASEAISRHNHAVLQSTSESKFLSLVPKPYLANVPYIYKSADSARRTTVWLVIDDEMFETKRGRDIIASLLHLTKRKPKSTRLGFVPLSPSVKPSRFWKTLLSPSFAIDDEAIKSLLEIVENTKAMSDGDDDVKPIAEQLKSLGEEMQQIHGGSTPMIVCNGRMIELTADISMGEEDIGLLMEQEQKIRTKHVIAGSKGLKIEDDDTFLGLASLAAAQAQNGRQLLDFSNFDTFQSLMLRLDADEKQAAAGGLLEVKVIIDPLSKDASRVASVLKMLHENLGASVQVLFVPEPSISKFPISSFTRFILETDDSSNFPMATFENMPQEQLLTLKISTPEPWIVFPLDTDGLDTDNIRVGRADGDCTVRYGLNALLVTGHCQDASARGSPPAGLQLQMGHLFRKADESSVHSDTLVMKNLGYWQLQAMPGTWRLSIAPGPSLDLYRIHASTSLGAHVSPWFAAYSMKEDGHQGHDNMGNADDSSKVLTIRDFVGHVEQLVVKKRPGKEGQKLLDSLEETGSTSTDERQQQQNDNKVPKKPKTQDQSWTGWLMRKIFGDHFDQNVAEGLAAMQKSSKNDTIHVFSLASGALYERFMRIMMVSVTKRTENPVKFWLIENFLSPDFKRTIPTLAQHYGFEYALVTYKWPHWLRHQTEKQRIIWGYKILFLDVLFPLDVPKVIYVDSDQVVRADLKELWDMDLKGRPYGYTPFCDSRKETLGFQFWRSGYWKDHLRGRPYHISALYVVDLVKFRRMMVGDRLRAIYDQLSRDPNSLSNLDQDLPNYAQNMVPIYSLPQEWLWCESWCSDESKANAKTIDLCNNPLHKEPKLDMAKRVISGELFPQSWIELDEEIKQVINH